MTGESDFFDLMGQTEKYNDWEMIGILMKGNANFQEVR